MSTDLHFNATQPVVMPCTLVRAAGAAAKGFADATGVRTWTPPPT